MILEQFLLEKDFIEIEIDDKRLPGGSPKEIEKDYSLKVTTASDGTFTVAGKRADIEDYLEDYAMTHLLDEKNTMEVELKDEMRINDIIRKSGGDKSKAEALAKTMASRITDRYKAIRRERAARSLGHPELAQIFRERSMQLNEELVEESDFLNENKQQSAMQALNSELSWNPHKILKATASDAKDYGKENLTPENGLIYWGMAGQSLVKDIRDALQKHGINASVFRGYETGRQSQEHDYIIILK